MASLVMSRQEASFIARSLPFCCAARVNYTVDGGRHWKASADIKFPPNTPDDYPLSFPRRDRAYVIGPHGMIYGTRNLDPTKSRVKVYFSGITHSDRS